MLIQFRFKNFMSYGGEALFDMRAVDEVSHRSHSVASGFEEILPVAAIYGPNASGKSNFMKAFKLMTNHVLNGWNIDDIQYCAFALDVETEKDPSEFEVLFSMGDGDESEVYNYGFVIGTSGILEEWLNLKTSAESGFLSIFYREMNAIDDDHLLGVDTSSINERLNGSVLLLSLCDELELEILRPAYEWFGGNTVLTDMPDTVSCEPDGNVVKYLKACGLCIEGLVADDGNEDCKIRLLHKVKGSDGLVAMPLEMESSGTKKLISLYGYLSESIRHGSLLMIDDLDVHLHPLVVRLMISAFTDPDINPHHAQLVFTTHDSWQLDSDMLHRDEFWFVDMNDDHESELYAFSEFKIGGSSSKGKNRNMQNDHMLGKFGAIPKITPLDMLNKQVMDV